MQKIIQIYPCLLKLSRKQESVTDGQPLLLYPLTAIARGQQCKNTKGVGMIRAEIGLKNRQIMNETYSFRCFLIL
jgi:hypothetical protein